MSKKIISIFLVLSMLMSLCTFSVLADGDVLLSYSFESESEGWTYYGKDSTELSDKMATDGKKSLHVNDVSDATGGFQSPMLEAIVGETYTATIDVNAVVSGTNFILRFSDANKKKVADKQIKPSKTGEWETLTATLAAPEGAVYVHMLVATFGASFGEAYYDNAKLMGKSKTVVSTPKEEEKQAEAAPIVVGDGVKYKTEVEFLGTIGLWDASIDLKANVTKAQMAKIIAKAMHPELDFTDTVTGVAAFNDVPASHEYYSYIKACRDLGVVKGDYDNNFNPDNQLTAIEAMTMVINALGYTPYAEAFGGYPSGYFQVATKTGIARGISSVSSELATGEVVAKIIYNAMFADIVTMGAISNGSVELEINNGKNILSERLGIYEYEGLVIDNGIGAIEGTTMGDTERAVIKEASTGKTYTAFTNGTPVNEYLGYKVKAFIRNNPETGRNEFVYVAPHANYETVTLNARYIYNVTNNYVEYDEDDTTADYEKYNLGGSTPVIIVNGVRITSINNQTTDPLLQQVMPKDGIITLIDNTGDSTFDVVNILSFNYANGSYQENARNILVDNVDTTEDEHSISCAYDPSKSLDLGENEAGYAFVANEKVKTINDVKQGMIISVAQCPENIEGKPYYFLVAHDEKVDSKLSGKAGNTIILENGSEYELSTSLKTNFINYLSMGGAVKVYLDVTGNVAYVESEGGNAKNYAYIVTAVKRMRAGQEVMLAKIFTKKGEMLELPLSDKVRIDGELCDTLQKQEDALNKRYLDSENLLMPLSGSLETIDVTGRPAIVDIKDDKITKIDTDYQNQRLNYIADRTVYLTPTATSDESRAYATQWPIPYSNEDANSVETLKAGFRSPRYQNVEGSSKTMEGKFFITNNSTVIAVPEIDTYGIKDTLYKEYAGSLYSYAYAPEKNVVDLYEMDGDEHYKIMSANDVSTRMVYDVQGYDIDPETGVEGLVILRGRTDVYFYGSNPYEAKNPMQIYSRKSIVYDAAKEKEVTKIYYYENGKEMSGIIDLEDAFFAYKAIIEGCNAGDTPYNTAVPALRAGDVIKVVKSGDSITHIERVLRVNEYEKMYTYSYLPSMHRSPYQATNPNGLYQANITASNNPHKYATDRLDAFPFDMRYTRNGAYSTYCLGIGYVEQVNGSLLKIIGARSEGTSANKSEASDTNQYNKIGKLDLSDPTRYTEQYIDLGSIEPMIVNFSDDGKEIEVKMGTVNDIKTLIEENDILENSSVILYRHDSYVLKHVIILNGIENVKRRN